MAAPLSGLAFAVIGRSEVLGHAGDLLELLGATVLRVDRVESADHARRIAHLDVVSAIDATGRLGRTLFPTVALDDVDPTREWVGAGLCELTGDAGGHPLLAGAEAAPRLLAVGAVIQLLGATRRVVLDIDSLQLLAERSAITGFRRGGSVAVGGSARFERASDGWIALNLARPSDIEMLPALIEAEVDPGDWSAVQARLRSKSTAELLAQSTLLGLPLAAPATAADAGSPWSVDGAVPRPALRPPAGTAAVERPGLVIDLSSLWAGPLGASVLAMAGARVIKIEGATRPDGARRGPGEFFDLLNGEKEMVTLDFASARDLELLRALIAAADVVIEASRPRVMAQIGIDPVAAARAGTTWISITGHGRAGDAGDRVAFGDDAAVAGGFVVPGEPPRFVGDAIADPIAGLFAAAAGLAALVGHPGQLFDLSLAGAAAYARGGGAAVTTGDAIGSRQPRARRPTTRAARPGSHTEAIRTEFGC